MRPKYPACEGQNPSREVDEIHGHWGHVRAHEKGEKNTAHAKADDARAVTRIMDW